jgi:rhodanese-related sulfurtransferase
LLLVDVRPTADYTKGHISGAINILDEEIPQRLDEIKQAANVIFYCNTGSRSAAAYYAAEDHGVKHTRYLSRNVDIAADGSFTVK